MEVIKLEAHRPGTRKQKINGIEFRVAISPFFVPDRLEHGYDKDSGCYVIDFRYLDDEPGEEHQKSNDIVSLTVGKHTGRLLSVCIHVDKHELDRVQMIVTDEIPRALNKAKVRSPNAAENYDMASEFLQEHKQEFVPA